MSPIPSGNAPIPSTTPAALLEGQQSDPSTEFFEVNVIQSLSSEFEDDQIDSDFGCTHQSFDELCEEEIRMFD